jgi:hypothetical protein
MDMPIIKPVRGSLGGGSGSRWGGGNYHARPGGESAQFSRGGCYCYKEPGVIYRIYPASAGIQARNLEYLPDFIFGPIGQYPPHDI